MDWQKGGQGYEVPFGTKIGPLLPGTLMVDGLNFTAKSLRFFDGNPKGFFII